MQRLVSLFGRLFQCVQFFFCRLNLRLQRLVFLGKEVCIARIQLEELIDILQLAFRIFDFGIDVLEEVSSLVVSPPISIVMPFIRPPANLVSSFLE